MCTAHVFMYETISQRENIDIVNIKVIKQLRNNRYVTSTLTGRSSNMNYDRGGSIEIHFRQHGNPAPSIKGAVMRTQQDD